MCKSANRLNRPTTICYQCHSPLFPDDIAESDDEAGDLCWECKDRLADEAWTEWFAEIDRERQLEEDRQLEEERNSS